MTVAPEEFASVRYIVDDVPAAIDFYTTQLNFLRHSAGPAFALMSSADHSACCCQARKARAPAPLRGRRHRRPQPHPPDRRRPSPRSTDSPRRG